MNSKEPGNQGFKFRPFLFQWLMRTLHPVTMAALPIPIFWTLFIQTPLFENQGWALFFIIAHSFAIVTALSRTSSDSFAFLHARPFSRDTLWAHTMLASLGGVLLAWLPAALILWLGWRSALLDRLQNPYYPIMASREMALPWRWLLEYAIFLPIFHYEWIRRLQPARGSDEGAYLAVGILLAFLMFTENPLFARSFPFLAWLTLGLFACIAAALLIAGWRLYRRVEVHA